MPPLPARVAKAKHTPLNIWEPAEIQPKHFAGLSNSVIALKISILSRGSFIGTTQKPMVARSAPPLHTHRSERGGRGSDRAPSLQLNGVTRFGFCFTIGGKQVSLQLHFVCLQ